MLIILILITLFWLAIISGAVGFYSVSAFALIGLIVLATINVVRGDGDDDE